jgi:ferritin-like metal-binding protein YciE
MPDDKLQQKLVDYVQDVHAMEQNVSTMLTSMISTTDDPQITEMLKHHKQQTEEHERRLRERLAKRAGDKQAMARKIASNWNRFLDLTLATPGFLAE